jgi:hypothetical protein
MAAVGTQAAGQSAHAAGICSDNNILLQRRGAEEKGGEQTENLL